MPKSARTKWPARSVEELLTEARSVTAGWPDSELNADRIRTTLRTSPARARVLRDALKAERAEQSARPALHAVPDTDPVSETGAETTVDDTDGEDPQEEAS